MQVARIGVVVIGIGVALRDLVNDRSASVEEVVDRYFAADYRQRTDGVWSDRIQFIEHIRHLREIVAHVEVRVLDELERGSLYADRHEVHLAKSDGQSVVHEVFLFGTRAGDGRFSEVHEVTHLLVGGEGDRRLGTASLAAPGVGRSP